MKIKQLDHLVLTVKNIQTSLNFYSQVLGMQVIRFADNRQALQFGSQKINLHQQAKEFTPHAQRPTPGSADLCFITDTPMDELLEELHAKQINLIEGPVERHGATGKLNSIYIYDPDFNLLEISNQLPA